MWKKDGVVVENTQFIPVDNSTGILRFVKIQTEHYGTYQCFASNTYGTSLSTPFNLKESSNLTYVVSYFKLINPSLLLVTFLCL